MSDPLSANAIGAVASTAQELATPVLADLVGLAGGDWLHQVRIRNVSRLEARTREILRQRGYEQQFAEISPAYLEPAVNAAANESSDELLDLWARLIAAAADPKRAKTARKSFVALLQQFDPVDALVFKALWDLGSTTCSDGRNQSIAQRHNLDTGVVAVSFENLFRLKCIRPHFGGPDMDNDPQLTPIGRELGRTLFT
jgi:hypothetical protein